MLSPDTNDLPTEVAGRYVVEGEVGRGGTSIVYRARDRHLGRVVALKVLRPEFAESIGAKRFLREIALTETLEHQDILSVLDRGEANGHLFVVLPFMEGGTLRDRLRFERQLTINDVITITEQVAGALEYAHSRKVVHRDVKPENILFSGDRAHLGDFGIARVLERALGQITTTTGVIRGTPAYMSPEQAAGERKLDARTDVYALGCVVYEMLAGMPPFVGPTEQSLMAQRITHGPRPLSVYRPSVSPAMASVVDRALTPAAADRWQTAMEFAEALRSASDMSLTTADTEPPRLQRTAVNRVWHRRFGITSLVLTGVIVFAVVQGGPPNQPPMFDVQRSVIAVIPFSASSPADSIWRTGLLDVLARSFDGAGPLRAVPPSVVIGNWDLRSADTVTAAAFGKRVRAGVVLFGLLGHKGPDSLRLSATLFDVIANRTLGEFTAEDDAEHFLRLTDTLTTRVLRRLSHDRPIAAVRGGSFSSASLPAIKAFLQGEQLLRRNRYVEAESSYATAVAEDPRFALAWHRMRSVRRAIYSETDDSSFAFALRAGQLNQGLSPRDSLLIRADSLNASLPRTAAVLVDARARQTLAERARVLSEAADRYPDDPEIWEELGEVRHHYGDRLGVRPEQALQAFERAIAGDSNYLPPYMHTIQLAVEMRGPAVAHTLLTSFQRRNSTSTRYELATSLLRQHLADSTRPLRLAPVRAPSDLRDAAILLMRWPDSTRISERLFRAVLEWQPSAEAASLRASAEAYLAFDLLYHGRAREARSVLTPAMFSATPSLALYLAWLNPDYVTFADSLCRQWLQGNSVERLLISAACFATSRDTAALVAVGRRFAALASPETRDREIARYGSMVTQFYVALANANTRRDSMTAATMASRLPDSLCTWRCEPERLLRAELALALGQPEAAANVLDAHPPSASRRLVSEVLWHLARSRAANGLGDSASARRSLDFAGNAWATADSVPRSLLARTAQQVRRPAR